MVLLDCWLLLSLHVDAISLLLKGKRSPKQRVLIAAVSPSQYGSVSALMSSHAVHALFLWEWVPEECADGQGASKLLAVQHTFLLGCSKMHGAQHVDATTGCKILLSTMCGKPRSRDREAVWCAKKPFRGRKRLFRRCMGQVASFEKQHLWYQCCEIVWQQRERVLGLHAQVEG